MSSWISCFKLENHINHEYKLVAIVVQNAIKYSESNVSAMKGRVNHISVWLLLIFNSMELEPDVCVQSGMIPLYELIRMPNACRYCTITEWAAVDFSPFSACSMICRIAFFKLFARNINCSLGRKICGLGEQAGLSSAMSHTMLAVSPSSCSSAIVGGGFGREDIAWDSSLSVLSSESSFSLRTEHCS